MRPIFALLTTAMPAIADEWVMVSRTNIFTYEARVGSLERTHTVDSQQPVVVLTFRETELAKRLVKFEKNYVSVAHCQAGLGKLVTAQMDGQVLYDNDFISDGGNVASTIARTIYMVAFPTPRPGNLGPAL